MEKSRWTSFFSLIIPGMLIAATGVGAGDLATASFSGSRLGVSILWAVVLGGVFKYVLTEGLARVQLVTGETFLEAMAGRFGRIAGFLFLPYLFLWTFFVGSALASACGASLHAMIPFFESPQTGKIFFGVASSLTGLFLVWAGGFKLFEKIMTAAIGVMFVVVMLTAALLWPSTSEVLSGLLIVRIAPVEGALGWSTALIGGVGGTLTILCYGYWIKEKGRTGAESIKLSRIDLGAGYVMTILFGAAMVIIGSSVSLDGKGAGLLITLASKLENTLGATGKWLFLIGAFGAIFSSLLGVWQAVPYLFADIWSLFIEKRKPAPTEKLSLSKPYRIYLLLIATVPLAGLWLDFKEVQKLYAVIGALFIPMLALALLFLNSNRERMKEHKNGPASIVFLSSTLLFFGYLAWMKWLG